MGFSERTKVAKKRIKQVFVGNNFISIVKFLYTHCKESLHFTKTGFVIYWFLMFYKFGTRIAMLFANL